MNKELVFTAEEAAEYLKTNPQTIRRMLREGKIPAAKVGREWRIHKDALDAYLKGKKPN